MARLQAGMRTTELAVQAGADPRKAAARVASFHRGAVLEVRAHNASILGRSASRAEITTVDGKRGAPLESVKLDGGRIEHPVPVPGRRDPRIHRLPADHPLADRAGRRGRNL